MGSAGFEELENRVNGIILMFLSSSIQTLFDPTVSLIHMKSLF